jgi:hypothetical protein
LCSSWQLLGCIILSQTQIQLPSPLNVIITPPTRNIQEEEEAGNKLFQSTTVPSLNFAHHGIKEPLMS